MMAVNLVVVEKNLEDLEKEVTCPVCQEYYTDPKILPCLHYYCKQCILGLSAKVGKNKPFSCPECRKNTMLPKGGVEELRSAFFVNRLKSIYDKHKKAIGKRIQCEMCDATQASAEAFCQQCGKFACLNCVRMHSTMKQLFDKHKMVSVEQLQTIKVDELVPKHLTPDKCRLHDELLKIFCFSCNEAICRDCTVKDHRDHNIEFNSIAAKNVRKQLLEGLKPLREFSNSLSNALEEVRKTDHEVKVQGGSVTNIVESSFEELQTILANSKQQLLEEVKRRVREKKENLKRQEKDLSIASTGVQSVIDHTEQVLRHCSDDEVMSMHVTISHRIKEEVEHSKSESSLKPVEKADMSTEVGCADALKQLCQNARITSPADYMQVVKKIPSIDEVNEEVQIVVSSFSNPTKAEVNLESWLKCLPDGPVSKSNIERKDPNTYEISCTPSVRGLHEVSIIANGHPLPGSPFHVTIQVPPTQFGEPVNVRGKITSPYSMAVNSVGELIVGSYKGFIEVLDKEGKSFRIIEHSKHLINSVRGIALDSEDNMYFVGTSQNKIGKVDRKGENLQVHEIEQIKGPGYWDIAVVGDEVMVTEHDNEGQIMVYDTELNYVRVISSENKITFRHLHSDPEGILYISTSAHTIQVINKSGKTLRSFNCDCNGVQQLKNPWIVYVSGQYVYVTDNILKKMVVFTTEGRYVTTFGCYGGICINKEGTVFVSDYCKHRIVCY